MQFDEHFDDVEFLGTLPPSLSNFVEISEPLPPLDVVYGWPIISCLGFSGQPSERQVKRSDMDVPGVSVLLDCQPSIQVGCAVGVVWPVTANNFVV